MKNKSVFTIKIIGLLIISGLLNISCNGENSPETLIVSGASPVTASYLPFQGSVRLMDPAEPAAPPVTVETSNITGARVFFNGTYDTSSKTVFDFHTRTLIYGAADGSLQKINLLKEGKAPKNHTQISIETKAAGSCFHRSVFDFADHNKSQYVYAIQDKNGNCNIWKMIKVGMSVTDIPFSAKSPVNEIYDFSNGSLTGWLAKDGDSLYRYDENFSSPELVTSYSSSVGLADSIAKYFLLNVDGNLHIYDTETRTYSDALYTIKENPIVRNDGENFFILDATNSIYKLPVDGSTKPAKLAEEDENKSVLINNFMLTDNKVVYQWADTSRDVDNGKDTDTYGLKTILKTGGNPVVLVDSLKNSLWLYTTGGGQWVYYQLLDDKGTYTAASIKDDKSGVMEKTNGKWLGTTFSLDISLYNDNNNKKRIFMAAGTDPDTGSVANSSLESYNIKTSNKIATLGTIPSEFSSISVYGNGYHILFSGWESANESNDFRSQNEIFYVNSDLNDSLTRVTETPFKTERLIY